MVDPVGGVGGVQDTLISPGSDRGVAVTVGGGGASACGIDTHTRRSGEQYVHVGCKNEPVEKLQ